MTPGARRAAALAQLGRLSEVESELRRLHGDLDASEDSIFLALSVALEAPSAQLRAAEYGGPEIASGFCPTTSFAPEDGFQLDRALIYAIVRQESYFNPKAVSTSNALRSGLGRLGREMTGCAESRSGWGSVRR